MCPIPPFPLHAVLAYVSDFGALVHVRVHVLYLSAFLLTSKFGIATPLWEGISVVNRGLLYCHTTAVARKLPVILLISICILLILEGYRIPCPMLQ